MTWIWFVIWLVAMLAVTVWCMFVVPDDYTDIPKFDFDDDGNE